jgi:hypothetical protein
MVFLSLLASRLNHYFTVIIGGIQMLKRNKNNAPQREKKGQSTVEYILLVAAVLAALIIFLRPGGVFQTAFNDTVSTGTNGMTFMANRLATSRP